MLFLEKAEADAPSTTVVASTMVVIVNITALTAGATVLIMNMITVINPAFMFNPLLAKNLTFAFGHIFANSTIYMAVRSEERRVGKECRYQGTADHLEK